MNIDDSKLLFGFFMNKDRNPLTNEFEAGIGVKINKENFDKSCDMLYTMVHDMVGKDDKWSFFFSMMVSVVNSIKEKRPDIMDELIEITR